MTDSLHLVRLVLDRRALARVAVRHHLPRNIDGGYFLHAGLSQLFATSDAPADVPLLSFAEDDVYASAMGKPDLMFILGYATDTDTTLSTRMGVARSEILRHCESRLVPDFAEGQRCTFRTRVCPIVRTKVEGDRPLRTNTNGKTRSREVDAFVHAMLGVSKDTPLSRETVYADWLRKQIGADHGCTLDAVRLAEHRREVMPRRGASKPSQRPNVVLEGTLTITDPAAFRALLARGIGRHRAFGFGMLLLRPA